MSARLPAVRSIAWLGLSGSARPLEILSKDRSILISLLLVRCRWWTRIDLQDVIISKTRMNVNMKMGHFLKCRVADGVPETQALVREYDADRTSDPRHGR